MQHDPAIRQLKEIGERQGYVTLEQIKSLLPIDTMSQDELGRAVLQLEEAGVEVRLEEGLLRSRPENWNGEGFPAHLLHDDTEPEPAQPEPPARRPVPTGAREARAGGRAEAPSLAPDNRRTAPLALFAVLALVVVAVILLYALLR